MQKTFQTPAAAVEVIKNAGAVAAIRGGACGPNGNLRRNTWEIIMEDGTSRTGTAAEARKLNALHFGYGVVTWEAKPGAIRQHWDAQE